MLQEIEENRRRTTLEKLLTCGDTCGGAAGSGVGNLFARSAAGDQADDFQFRQRRIGAHVQAQPITATGNRQNHAIIPHLRLRLDIDDRLYSQRIYKIDVAARDRIAISLKDQRSTACLHMAGQRRLGKRTLQVDIDSRLDIRLWILNRDIAAALNMQAQLQSAGGRKPQTQITFRQERKKIFEAAAV